MNYLIIAVIRVLVYFFGSKLIFLFFASRWRFDRTPVRRAPQHLKVFVRSEIFVFQCSRPLCVGSNNRVRWYYTHYTSARIRIFSRVRHEISCTVPQFVQYCSGLFNLISISEPQFTSNSGLFAINKDVYLVSTVPVARDFCTTAKRRNCW